MASCGHLVVLAIFAVLPYLGAGDTCLTPEVKSSVYTTTDSTMSTSTVVVAEFAVSCKNGLKDMNLFAEFNGKTLPASRVEGSNKYQVSFSDDHKEIPAAEYNMRFFDEEGYGDLRKAQRSGENVNDIKSIFNIKINHQGASEGIQVQSEFVAASVAILVWYMAYSARSRLQR